MNFAEQNPSLSQLVRVLFSTLWGICTVALVRKISHPLELDPDPIIQLLT